MGLNQLAHTKRSILTLYIYTYLVKFKLLIKVYIKKMFCNQFCAWVTLNTLFFKLLFFFV